VQTFGIIQHSTTTAGSGSDIVHVTQGGVLTGPFQNRMLRLSMSLGFGGFKQRGLRFTTNKKVHVNEGLSYETESVREVVQINNLLIEKLNRNKKPEQAKSDFCRFSTFETYSVEYMTWDILLYKYFRFNT